MGLDAASRRRGCLLGGAIGDALGAPIEFMGLNEIRAKFGSAGLCDFVPEFGRLGAITDDTQMTMFTAEGLIRARVRWLGRGMVHTPSVVWNAYQRWLLTQGEGGSHPVQDQGWLIGHRELHSARAPGLTCLSALRGGVMGSREERLNDSKGCGGVMRVAPAAMIGVEDPFEVAVECAALTHSHPSGYLSAGALALMIARILDGATLPEAISAAVDRLRVEPSGAETLQALEGAIQAADAAPASPETIETLGGGWVGEEALAIAVFAALKAEEFDDGVLLAVNHSGDSDSTGAICGNILGALLGEEALPRTWIEGVELADVIAELADDIGRVLEMSSEWDGVGGPPPDFAAKYPGT